MIRKAETLASIDELNLSKRTRTYYKSLTADELIKCGRGEAYDYEKYGSFATKSSKELVEALKEAGFIRPAADFKMYFNVASLYKAIYVGDEWQDKIVTSLGGFTNEDYENFNSLTDEKLEEVEDVLGEILTERECEIICFRFGLTNGSMQTLETTGRHFNVTRERIRHFELKALRKLMRYRSSLPAVIVAPEGFFETVDKVEEELDKLHQDPIFTKEYELKTELEKLSKMPFRKAEMVVGAQEVMLDDLDLPVRIHNCLLRAGIKSLLDILNYPKEDWFKVKYVRGKHLKEVEEKVRTYDKEFYIFS